MKKPITIPKLDADLYEKVKNYCIENNISVSDYFNKLLSENESAEEIESVRVENDKLKTLLTEKSDLLTALEFASAENQEKTDKLIAENKSLSEENIALQTKIRQLEEKSDENQHDNYTVLVRFTPLEHALINLVAEKETQRLSEEINPCDILRTMFIEYSLRGSEWFFPYPKRKEIEMLKEKLKKQE